MTGHMAKPDHSCKKGLLASCQVVTVLHTLSWSCGSRTQPPSVTWSGMPVTLLCRNKSMPLIAERKLRGMYHLHSIKPDGTASPDLVQPGYLYCLCSDAIWLLKKETIKYLQLFTFYHVILWLVVGVNHNFALVSAGLCSTSICTFHRGHVLLILLSEYIKACDIMSENRNQNRTSACLLNLLTFKL